MDVTILERQFGRIGARARVRRLQPDGRFARPFLLDVIRDARGELFDIAVSTADAPDVEVLQTEPKQRHLLLMTRDTSDAKQKFLCGHDERHWFAAAIPEHRARAKSVSTVREAMEALKPPGIVHRQQMEGVRPKNWNRRRNAAFIRQGEWFFVPEPDFSVDSQQVLRNEPLRRPGGKPHWVEFLTRTGGETVYVSGQRPKGLNQQQFNALVSRQPEARHWNWTSLRRNPSVYVRGRVRHVDHATITLHGWHRVLMNTETESAARPSLAFLD